MNILLVGEDAAGIQMLQHLRRTNHRIAGVMASPSRQDRGGASVWSLASKLGYKTWPSKLVKDPSFAARIVSENVDILLNVHSLFLIHEDVLAAPRLGSYNLHPGPLPRYAGLNSASWAIYRGEVRHGVTLHKMEPGIDTGNIVYQAMVPVTSDETGLSLTMKCIDAGIPLVLRLLDVAAQNPSAIPSIAQDLTEREYFGREVPEGGRLSWESSARRVIDFVRACDYLPFPSPWGHPRTSLDGKDIGIAKVQFTGIPVDEPAGTVGAAVESAVEVACEDEWILVREVFEQDEYRPAAEVLRAGSRLHAAMEKSAIRVAVPSTASEPQPPAPLEPSIGRIEYWRKQLAGGLPVLEWPSDRVRPPVSCGGRVTQNIRVPNGLRQRAEALAGAKEMAWRTVLATGVAAVLGRYTAQEDIVLGGGINGQFVPLRLDLSGDPSFSELLRRTQETVAAALGHAVSLQLLEAELRPASDPSRHPFFQIAVGLQPLTVADSQAAAFLDVCIDAEDGADEATLLVTYNPALFDGATVARFMGHWRKLLEAAVGDPALSLSRLPMLTDDERRQILNEWNATSLNYPKTTIHALVSAQARKTPDTIAVEMDDRRLTYRELEDRSTRLARRLRKLEVGPDVPVGLCLERSPEMVVSLLAILKAGGAYVPLDPAFPRQRLQLMLEDAQPIVVVTQESLRDIAPGSQQVVVDRDWKSIEAESGETLDDVAGPRNLAYVLYTSGSTGKPKGVQVEHACVVNFLISMQREPGLNAADILLAVTTLSFDIAGLEIYLPLITGARLVLASTETARDGVKLGALLRRSGATVMQATPATWRLLLECRTDLEGLKVLCGGEAMPPDLAARLVSRARSVWNLYGPTETTIWSTVCRVDNVSEGPVTIGRPIANTQIYILDPHRNPVPVGAIGALYIGGDGVARGYMNRPELTAEKFVPDPFSSRPGARLYNTGDLARYRADGNIDFLGRSDSQVKVRGFRIELGEIEAVMAQHAGVKSAVVLVREDTPGDTRLVAYVVRHPARAPSNEDLRRLFADKLPKYMIPGHIVFMDAFPLTPNGKVDRRALPPPESTAAAFDEDYVPPRNSVEMRLVEIWEELLGVHPIGVQSSFFDLGGHSLLVIHLLLEIERVFGKSLTVECIFESETVEQLARVVGTQESHEAPAVVAIQKTGNRPPFFCLGAGPMFRPMARRFGRDQPFLGVRTNPAEWTHLSKPYKFEEIATVFAKKIRDHQPEGPYYIGGFCLSGVMAYEVARQFLAEGQEVKRLVLFYSLSPGYFASRSSRMFNLHLQFELAKYHLGNLRRLQGREFSQYAKDRVQGLIEKLRPQMLQTGSTNEQFLPELEEVGAAAAHNYYPDPSPVPTVLFRPAEDPRGRYWDRQYDWSKYVTAALDVHVVPGDHSTMFREPHVEVLAERMKSYLETDRVSAPDRADSLLTELMA
jgi:amino acid adenylation domain-containing protein